MLWLIGLGAGLYAVLCIAAHFNCAHSGTGLVCRPPGGLAGGGLVLVSIVTVALLTVAIWDARSSRAALVRTGLGVLILAGVAVAAHGLLATS